MPHLPSLRFVAVKMPYTTDSSIPNLWSDAAMVACDPWRWQRRSDRQHR